MELKEYIQQTLTDIIEGVAGARANAVGQIAPGKKRKSSFEEQDYVHFEIVVAAEKNAGGALKIMAIADAKAATTTEHRNTVSFNVPLNFQDAKPTEKPIRSEKPPSPWAA